MASSNSFKGESEKPSRGPSLDQPKVIDVSHILKHPHRANRPDHIVVILRGLPGFCFSIIMNNGIIVFMSHYSAIVVVCLVFGRRYN